MPTTLTLQTLIGVALANAAAFDDQAFASATYQMAARRGLDLALDDNVDELARLLRLNRAQPLAYVGLWDGLGAGYELRVLGSPDAVLAFWRGLIRRMEKELDYKISVHRAAAMIGCTPRHVRRLAERRVIKARRSASGLWLISVVSAAKYSLRQGTGSAPCTTS